MLNDGTCFRRNIFSSPRHRWLFKLKSHYNQNRCCLPVMGKSQCIANVFILSPSQRTPMVKSSTILNPSLLFFCPQGSATPYKRQRAGFCTYALFSRMVGAYNPGLSCAYIWQSRVQSSVSASIFEIQFQDMFFYVCCTGLF